MTGEMVYISRGQRMALMSKVKEYNNPSSLVGHWLEKKTGAITRRKTKIVSPIDDATFWIQKDVDKRGLLKKKVSDDIGYGIFTSVQFHQGDFILDYVGRLISQKEAIALADHIYICFFQLGKLKYSIGTKCIDNVDNFIHLGHIITSSFVDLEDILHRLHLGNESSSDGDDESYRPPAKTSFDFSSDENEDKPAIKKRVASARTRWSAEELGFLAEAFGGLDKPPCTEAIMKLCKNYPVFQKRKVAQIKSRAWHFINTGR